MKEVDESFEDVILIEPEEEKSSVDTQVVDEEFESLEYVDDSMTETATTTELTVISTEDFGSVSLAEAEEDYEVQAFNDKVQPILAETTKKAVGEAVRYQQDVLKLEVQEVLQDEVSYRLSKYEKRRRWRNFKDKLGVAFKFIIVLIIVGIILGNTALRTRVVIVAKDFGELIEGLIKGEEVSSNKLVDDLFEELDELNTKEIERGDEENE